MSRRSVISARVAALLGGVVVLASISCSDERSDAGPRVDDAEPADVEVGEDAPVDLSYVCGNRFLVSNAYSVPISVRYRVAGSSEEGTVEVAAAPSVDPAVSEGTIETRRKGTVQIFLDGKSLVARANTGVACAAAPAGPVSLAEISTEAAEAGQWTAPFAWPIVAVHMVLLPDGRVLSFGRTVPQVWDPATGIFTAVPSPARLFCAGNVLLSDGQVLVAGGHISNNHGHDHITLFTTNHTWTSGTPMARGRWYPTTTVMGNGDVVITAGRDEAGLVVTTPEVWSNGSIRQLTGAQQSLPYYPRAFLTANGSLFAAGPTVGTRFLSVSGSGSWKNGPKHLYGAAREYGSAVMYDDGKILYAGGARTTNTAEVINLNDAAPAWRAIPSMAYARRQMLVTILADGKVLVTHGTSGAGFNDVTRPVYYAELWNPASESWTTMAPESVLRVYHSTALLLPDGRVLSSGSGEGAGITYANSQLSAQIFSPPYLFNPDGSLAARPTITSAPSTIAYGQTIDVQTPDAGSVTRGTLIRLSSVTHAFNQSQLIYPLTFTPDAPPSNTLHAPAPASGNLAPPGPYMLFLLNAAGVPSVAKMVTVGP